MQRVHSSAGRFLVLALLLGHLLAIAMAWSPSLHQWLHGDNDAPEHQCAATAIIDGQMDQPDASITFVALAPQPTGQESTMSAPGELPATFRTGTRERGPPAA